MKKTKVNGNHEGDKDQYAWNGEVGRIPWLCGHFGLFNFRKNQLPRNKAATRIGIALRRDITEYILLIC
jgi:hypothetical protein